MYTAIWDLTSDSIVERLRDTKPSAFTPDGRHLIGTRGQDVVWCDVTTGQVERRFTEPCERALSARLSPNGKFVAAVCRPLGIYVWDVETGRPTNFIPQPTAKAEPLPPGEAGVDFNVLAWLPDSKGFIVGRSRAVPRLYDSTKGKLIREYLVQTPSHLGAFSADYLLVTPDGKTLIAGSLSSGWYAWDIPSGKLLPQPFGNGACNSLALAPDGKEFAVADHGRVDRYDAATLEPKLLCDGPRATIADLQFSPGGEYLAVATADQAVFLHEAHTGKLRWQSCASPKYRNGSICLMFTHDGRRLAASQYFSRPKLFETATGKELDHTINPDEKSPSIAFVPKGRDGVIAVIRPGNRFLNEMYDMASGQKVAEWTPSTPGYLQFGSTSTSHLLISNGDPNDLKRGIHGPSGLGSEHRLVAWDVLKHAEVALPASAAVELLSSVDVSLDGELLLGRTTGGTITLWRRGADEPAARLVLGSRPHKYVLSPDGRMVAWYGQSRKITLGEVASGRVAAEWEGHLNAVFHLRFSPDGRSLASGGADAVVLVWDVAALGVGKSPADDSEWKVSLSTLSGGDAALAQRTVWRLAATPEQTLPRVRQDWRNLWANANDAGAEAALLVNQLEAAGFAAREEAEKNLRGLGAAATTALRQAREKMSPEGRRRIEKLLTGSQGSAGSAKELLAIRLCQLMETIATEDATSLLQEWSKSEYAELAQEAGRTLRRFKLRAGK
jgi:WD40 repeat protein